MSKPTQPKKGMMIRDPWQGETHMVLGSARVVLGLDIVDTWAIMNTEEPAAKPRVVETKWIQLCEQVGKAASTRGQS